MKNQLTVFLDIFTYDGNYYDGNYHNVDFIKLNGCLTFGDNIQNAYPIVQDAMRLYLDDMTIFPKPSLNFTSISLNSF